jgi:hypothetical protein
MPQFEWASISEEHLARRPENVSCMSPRAKVITLAGLCILGARFLRLLPYSQLHQPLLQ